MYRLKLYCMDIMNRSVLIVNLCFLLVVGTPVAAWLAQTPVAVVGAANQQKNKKKSNGKKTPKKALTPQEEQQAYLSRRAEAVRYNAKIEAYRSRDISHRLGIWGQIGYSAIQPSAFAYDVALPLGFLPEAAGGVGGGAGIGYQLRYKRFLMTAGLEYQQYNSLTRIAPFSRAFASLPYGTMTYTYSYTDMSDKWQAGYMQIPLLFGMELADWYWQAGGKIGFCVQGRSRLDASLTTSIRDEELIDDLHNMASHSLVDNYTVPTGSWKQPFGLNAALSAEVGMSLDRWLQPKQQAKKKLTPAQQFAQSLHYRIALFAEYGLANILAKDIIPADAADIPADFSTVLGTSVPAAENLYTDVHYTSSLATASARSAALHPWMVGVKMAVYYSFPRKQKKPVPLPVEPLPRIAVSVRDEQTGKRVSGAQVAIEPVGRGKTQNKTTNSKGLAIARLGKGDYRLSVSKVGFISSDTMDYALSDYRCDTVHFRLTPEPTPVRYTLCGFVLAAERNTPLQAEVSVFSRTDSACIYQGSTNEEGLFVSNLDTGTYILSANAQGYMPLSTEVTFEQDTLRLYMSAIKKGIRVKIDRLYFALNETAILPQSEEALNNLAHFLMENAQVSIRIIGHTDAIGSDEANMTLSIGRAKAVRDELVKKGVSPARIEYDGRGESEPVATNETEEGRALNRRVEFEITDTDGADIQQIFY